MELAKMRTGFTHPCPSCGLARRISEKEAIRAHRRLDELEHAAGKTPMAGSVSLYRPLPEGTRERSERA
ncbi:MAG: hypothetical protein ABSC19_03080 [Syntrophorhabdales bacterium]